MRLTASLFVSLLLLCEIALARPLDEVVDSGYITIFVYKDYAPCR